jgi:hypothetical protein
MFRLITPFLRPFVALKIAPLFCAARPPRTRRTCVLIMSVEFYILIICVWGTPEMSRIAWG